MKSSNISVTIDMGKLLDSIQLRSDESYCLYVHRHDGYDFGYVGSTRNADDMVSMVKKHISDPTVFGVWVTLESGDGTTDVDILKIVEGSDIHE